PEPCSVTTNDDGTSTITCPDGTSSVIPHGQDGEAGEDGLPGEEGLATLLDIQEEPAGDACPYGGHVVRRGLDADRDGILDPEEVVATEYICAPPPGLDALIAIDVEAPGVNCPAGGYRVRSGQDADADGALDPGEVTATAYVCHGDDGLSALLRVEEE